MNGSNENYTLNNQSEFQVKTRDDNMIVVIFFFGTMLFCFFSFNRDLNELCYNLLKFYCKPCIVLKKKICPTKEKIYVSRIERELNQDSELIDSKHIDLYKDLNCSVCLDKILSEEYNEIVVLNCNHIFHKKCLSEWLTIENSLDNKSQLNLCPLCRNEVKIDNLFLLSLNKN